LPLAKSLATSIYFSKPAEKYQLHHTLPLRASVSEGVKRNIWDDEYVEFVALLPEQYDKQRKKYLPVVLEIIKSPVL
jgi:hypothetical protein